MRKNFRRLITIILVIVMLISNMLVAPVSVSATSQAENIVAIARNQIGQYSRPNKFSNYLGIGSSDWCAAFVCWCANEAGVSTDIVPKIASTTSLLVWYNSRGRWHRKNSTYWSYNGKSDNSSVDSSYTPRIGDIMLLDTDGIYSNGPDHTTLVTGYNNGIVYTIEGNISGNKVGERSYSVSSSKIFGFCNPSYSGDVPVYEINPDNYPVPTRDIYYNSSNIMTGSDVMWIQAVLYRLGYSIAVDGSFGPSSKAVVQQFQNHYGLNVDGSVGSATRQKLYDLWQNAKNSYSDIGTDFYAYITNTAYWLYLSNDYDNVSAKSPTYLTEQIWRFERQPDNSYVIFSSSNGKCLDVDNSNTSNGTNVKMCTYYGNDAQKWYLIKVGDNKYIIRSKLGNCVLDLTGGSNVSGTNIQVYEPNATDAQFYSIHKYETPSRTNINVETSGTNVEISWDTVNGTARYDVYLIQSPYGWDDVKYSKKVDFKSNYCAFKNVTPGEYCAFVITRPNNDDVQSKWASFTVTSDSLQPAKQVEYNGHIYSLYNDVLTWEEAKIQCEAMGGHLVTVNSEEEQKVIEELTNGQFCHWYFMGATNIENSIDYKWVTGEPFTYKNWRYDSPDNYMGMEHYLMMTTRQNGVWQDTTEDGWGNVIGFICEIETENIEPVTEAVFEKNTYKLFDNHLTWEDAEKYAEMLGGHLVTISSKEENEFVKNLMQNGYCNHYFLGADNKEDGSFKWVTNESFEFENWKDNEPNNENGIEHYLMAYKNTGQWNDIRNHLETSGYIVEFENTSETHLVGDINADGNINILDATMIQKHSAELELLDDNLCKYADVNGDGKVSVIDATLIQKYSAELITEF